MAAAQVETFRISLQQQRAFLLSAGSPGFPYGVQASFRIAGPLDPAALRAALGQVTARHEVLRTTFHRFAGMVLPVQAVGEAREPDLTAAAPDTPWDLEHGPLLRFSLERVSEREHVLHASLSALCADGASAGLLLAEIGRCYEAALGVGEPPPGLPLQYVDYAGWQHQSLAADTAGAEREHWLSRREEIAPALAVRAPAGDGLEPRRLDLGLPPETAAALEAFCAAREIAPEDILLACWQVLLARLAESPAVVGVAVDGRKFEELQEALGAFTSFVPVPARLGPDLPFESWLAAAGAELLGAFEHQEAFAWDDILPRRDEGVPYFPYLFESGVWPPEQAVGETSFSLLDQRALTEPFDLKLTVLSRADGGLAAELQYDVRRMGDLAAGRLAEELRTLVAAALASPGAAVGDLEIAGGEERRRLEEWGGGGFSYEPEPVHHLFEDWARRAPERIAVEAGGRSLTYGELNARANRLAHRLRALGVGPEVMVAILLERSPEMLVAILGVLKAGGAYVPLDPTYPRDRLAFILADTRAAVLLTRDPLASALPSAGARVVLMDQDGEPTAASQEEAPEVSLDPGYLAYVIYTSGSTGRPKGVQVSHGNLAHSTRARLAFYEEPVARYLLASSFSFDSSVAGIFWTLAQGGALVLPSDDFQQNLTEFVRFVESARISHLLCLPGLHRVVLEQGEPSRLSALRAVIVAGEACLPDLVRLHHSRLPGTGLFNEYGPTEGTVWSTACECTVETCAERVPIGRAVGGTRLRILSPRQRAVPIGASGELWIGGDGLARGYLDRPDLTAERFVPDPFAARPGERLYRTGDRVRFLPDGQLDFQGRFDHQVKIRGYRIEIGEIEAVIDRMPGVREVAVVAREETEAPGQKRLVAYVLPAPAESERITIPELRRQALQALPDFMVPAVWVLLHDLPRTPNGKIDRRALPDPAEVDDDDPDFVAPRTAAEEVLAAIWGDVLGREAVGVNANFFELGGNSLVATQLVSRVRAAFRVELPQRTLFQQPTVAGLAAQLDDLRRSEIRLPPLTPAAPGAPAVLSFQQERLWFFDQLNPGSNAYNLLYPVSLVGTLDVEALRLTLAGVVRRHGVLRTRFQASEGQPRQVAGPEVPPPVPVIDLCGLSTEARQREALRLAMEAQGRSFDLTHGPLLWALLLRLSGREHRLLVGIHQIVFDGWSLGILVREFAELYRAAVERRPPSLAELPVQYVDFAHWQRGWMQGELVEAQLAYWRGHLGERPAVAEVAADRPRQAGREALLDQRWLDLPAGLAASLKALSRRRSATPFMSLLAVIDVLLHRYTGADRVHVGTLAANRNQPGVEQLIGFFVNTLALASDLSGDPPFTELLDRVRDAALGANDHQDLPFERVIEAISPARTSGGQALFQVMFVFQNAPLPTVDLPDLMMSFPRTGGTERKAALDLAWAAAETEEGLAVVVEYNRDLFDPATIARMLGHFETLLRGFEADPEQRLSQLPMLSAAEACQLYREVGRSGAEDPMVADLLAAAQAAGGVPVASEEPALVLLDPQRRLVPLGVPGRVHLTGLAPAEVGATGWTAARLLPGEPEVWLWAGEESARYRADGSLDRGPAGAADTAAASPEREAAESRSRAAARRAEVSDLRSKLSARQQTLLAQRLRREVKPQAPRQEIPRRAESGPAPLSFSQERLWFLERMEPGSTAYNLLDTVRLTGGLDAAALDAALREIVRRHEALATTFTEAEGTPFAVVSRRPLPPLPRVDLAGLPADRRLPEALQLAGAEAGRPFDLAAGPLVRALLLRLGEREHVLALVIHHLVSDAWSFGILIRELATLYAAGVAGSPSPLAPPAVQYSDFAVWQRERLRGAFLEELLAAWRTRLAGAPPLLELPSDRPRPPRPSLRGALERLALPAGLSTALAELGRRHGGTPFMTLLAGWAALLSRHTGAEDLLIGTPVAGRNHSELEGLIGLLTNTLVLRVDLSGDPPVRELLLRVRDVALEAQGRQDLPFEKLVEALAPERSLAHTPLFQVLFVLQNAAQELPALPGLAVEVLPSGSVTAKFDLTLSLQEGPQGFHGALEYSTDLFDPATVRGLLARFERLLAGMASAPEGRLSELPLLDEAEREQVLKAWNGTQSDYPREATLAGLFQAQAERAPAAEALDFFGERLTYAELDARANRLARHLRSLGIGRESLVAVLLGRSTELIVTLLAIVKAGGAYVPLDPSYPAERLAWMLEDSGAAAVVTREDVAAALPAGGARKLLLDREAETIASWSPEALETLTTADELAYVMYTSGSTGRPKGVAIPQRGIVRLLFGTDYITLGPDDRVAQLVNVCFDVATFEVWGALLHGGCLVGIERDLLLAPRELGAALVERRITVAFLTTPLFNQVAQEMPEAFRGVRHLFAGGEALDPVWVRAALEKGSPGRMINGYGPTESTTYAVCHRVERVEEAAASVPIGRPIANTTGYVVDPGLHPVPAGVMGELLIGGDGLARGYWRRPGLTAERFVPNPFGEPGSRLYRTGDLVRWLPDGLLDFLGRIDHQVKVRGFRVELGEIEAALAEHPGVGETLVLASEGGAGGKRLVAYLTRRPGRLDTSGLEPGSLRDHLAGRLPDYMIPAAFVILDAFPLTHNGKVDRRALPSPEPETAAAAGRPATPGDPVAEILAGIWAEVLGVPAVGVDDSFFELGGHSLLAAQVISRVRRSFGLELPLAQLFETPTVAGFAGAVRQELTGEAESRGGAPVPLLPVPRQGALPLSFAQQRLWFIDQLQPGSAAYNIPAAFRLEGPLRPDLLARCLAEVSRRHEVLRTRFPAVNGEPVLAIDPVEPSAALLPLVDLAALPAGRREAEARRLAGLEAARPFDLSSDRLWRALLVRLQPGEHLLGLTVHHIVSDGWSMGLLIQEAAALYGGLSVGRAPSLPDLPVQYADWAVWQRRRLSGETLAAELAYWRRQLGGMPPVLELPADRVPPAVRTPRGGLSPFSLDASLTRGLRALGRRSGATLFMALLASFQTVLARWSHVEEVSVGTPVAGRDRLETEALIGLFVNTLVMRTDLAGDPAFGDLLERVRAFALGAYAHQELPFEKLVEELAPERNVSHTPLFQVMLALQTLPRRPVEVTGLRLTPMAAPMAVGAGSAKFSLSLTLWEEGEALGGEIEYSRDLFDPPTVLRLAGYLETLVRDAVEDPGRRLSRLRLLTPAQRFQLLAEWNDTGAAFPRGLCAHEVFERQAARTPEALAVCRGAEQLTYRQLDRRANRLARRLLALGVERGSRVGVCLEREPGMVAGLLAVLKAGAAYVPLDPDYPEERLAFLAADARLSVLITRAALAGRLAAEAALVLLDEPWEDMGPEDDENPARMAGMVGMDDLAYVIYTSGSTGRPKGVEVTHGGLLNLVFWHHASYGVTAADRASQLAAIAFDASVWELWPYLLAGASVHLAEEEVRADAQRVRAWLAEREITIGFLPTPLAEQILPLGWPAAEAAPRCLLTGGDRLHRNPPAGLPYALVNHYGPTEAAVVATAVRIDPDDNEGKDAAPPTPPIGRPIANVRVYLVDPWLEPVPIGAHGELLVGGAGVARGYLLRPELTAERFIPDPFGGEPGARLYRTGDLVRHLPGGNIEFLGRTDHQVKLRGFRIEPGEIEAEIVRHPAVREAAVMVRDEPSGEPRLVAYVVAEGAQPPAGLRAHLEQRLPLHMIPSSFVFLPELPLSPHGKLDRGALPAAVQGGPGDRPLLAPRDQLELQLVQVWEEVLGVRPLGVQDDFFALGGHSLSAVRLLARVEQAVGRKVPLVQLFAGRTVEQMAAHLRQGSPAETGSPLVVLQPGDTGAESPLFWVHPAGGGVLCYMELLRHLPGRTSYGFEAPGRNGPEPPLSSLGEMAERYLEELRGVQPEGPYRLLGWSMGGLVAFEMAQRLLAEGEEVAFLGLLDTRAPAPETAPASLDEVAVLVGFAQDLGLPLDALAPLREAAGGGAEAVLAAILEQAGSAGLVAPGFGLPEARRHLEVFRANAAASLEYQPRIYPGRVTLFRAAGSPPGGEDPDLGWGGLAAGGVTRHEVPGTHHTLVREPHARTLAGLLAQALDALASPLSMGLRAEGQTAGLAGENP